MSLDPHLVGAAAPGSPAEETPVLPLPGHQAVATASWLPAEEVPSLQKGLFHLLLCGHTLPFSFTLLSLLFFESLFIPYH